MTFLKYMHVERFGNSEVDGIELGKCFIFPKLDGTNASIWMDNGQIQAGSRKRHLSLDADNAGFLAAISEGSNILNFMHDHQAIRLYGEWLVPHSLKTYREDSWRQFYVFDVWDELNGIFIPYPEYQSTLEEYGVNYIPPIAIMRNPSYESMLKELENNTFLIQEGKGIGEGVVVKNYDYQNKYGRVVWAKIITNQFKEKHSKTMGAPIKPQKEMIEQAIVDEYVTLHLIEKTHSKIALENDGWSSRMIPQLLGRVFYDLVREESWSFVKKFKNPTINFKTLSTVCIMKIKQLKPELF